MVAVVGLVAVVEVYEVVVAAATTIGLVPAVWVDAQFVVTQLRLAFDERTCSLWRPLMPAWNGRRDCLKSSQMSDDDDDEIVVVVMVDEDDDDSCPRWS